MSDTQEIKKLPYLEANIIFRGKIECVTGLHIGGSKERLEIGGVDSPVVRDPQEGYPYIPGSSLKGKLRTLLEYKEGTVGEDGGPSKHPKIVRIFGIDAGEGNEKTKSEDGKKVVVKGSGPTRLTVRDSYPDKTTINMWKELDTDLLYTEYKAENTINRITSEANPRFIERVVRGSAFELDMVYSIYNLGDHEANEGEVKDDLAHLLEALRMLEHNALGKSGSRGYGKIRFKMTEPIVLRPKDYAENTDNYRKSVLPVEDEDLKFLHELTFTYPSN